MLRRHTLAYDIRSLGVRILAGFLSSNYYYGCAILSKLIYMDMDICVFWSNFLYWDIPVLAQRVVVVNSSSLCHLGFLYDFFVTRVDSLMS